jgi:predicted CXXCH cytochrome family protein
MPIENHGDHRAGGPRSLSLALLVAFPITPLAGWPGRTSDDNSARRNGPGATNHPVNVIPSSAVTIPAGWPLGVDGTIVCTTCHSSLPRGGEKGGSNLRGGEEKTTDSMSFCGICHRQDGPTTAMSMHWMAVSKAHLFRDGSGKNAVTARGVDDGSHACLACHDGVNAPDAAYETGVMRDRGFLGDKSRNHPIGVPYPNAGTRGVEVPLRPAALLPDAIALPGGYVSCTSCHNLYAPEAKRLSVPIEGSRLCFTCHEMD